MQTDMHSGHHAGSSRSHHHSGSSRSHHHSGCDGREDLMRSLRQTHLHLSACAPPIASTAWAPPIASTHRLYCLLPSCPLMQN